jgi:HD-like signal output (HDOD) protein/ActR/RegA family two-component response regulator
MAEKRILLADADSKVWDEFRQALGTQWDLITVANGNAAMAEMKKEPCDVVIADLDLPGVDGAELLTRVRSKYPKAIRFILARESDQERVMKTVRGAHQFLTKPTDKPSLKGIIERALALDVWLTNVRLRELIARMRALPTIPALYLEVLNVLRSPDATTEQVGAVISKDMAMTTKLLQVINSPVFGLKREISSPAEAVGIVGFETVKSMVMTIKLLAQYDKIKPVNFSIDGLWHHSTDVARTAKQIVLWHTGDHALAETAFTAGLMHDLGKVVLATNFEDQYHGAQLLAYKQKLTPWEVELDVFGASHGEIGSYLLGLWGMPFNVVEAAAMHHQPSRTANKSFSPLTAVHIADVLEHENSPDALGCPAPALDEAYLADVGILDRVDVWREALYGKKPAKPAAAPVAMAVAAEVPAPAETSQTQIVSARKAGLQEQSRRKFVTNAVTFACVTVGVALVLVFTVWTGVRAREQDEALAKPLTNSISTVAKNPVIAAQSETNKSTTAAIAARPVTPGVASNSIASTGAATPVVAPAKSADAFPDLKLQGIFYSASAPSAIINGKMVYSNDKISEARVIRIGISNVVVEYRSQQKTLALK